MPALLEHPIGILLQNLWLTWPFFVTLITVIAISGAWIGILLSLIVASIVSFSYRKFINKLLAVPRKTAVLITGCSSGIGRDCALRLSSLGFFVFAGVRRESDATALKSEAVQRKGSSASLLCPIILDVSKEEEINAARDTVSKRLNQEGRALIALINNAGYNESCPLEVAPLSAVRKQYDTNVIGPVAVSQAFLPLLREAGSLHSKHGSRLVFISSVVGRFSTPGTGLYASSKYAIEAIGDAFRMELRKWNIYVTLIEPGAIDTQFLNRLFTNAQNNLEAARKGANALDPAVLDSYVTSVAGAEKDAKTVPKESTTWTSDALVSALLDSQPLSRYTAGWTALSIYPLVRLPSEIYDRLLGRRYR